MINEFKVGTILRNNITNSTVKIIKKSNNSILVQNLDTNDNSLFYIYKNGEGISDNINNYSTISQRVNKEQRVYWLDVQNNDYGDDVLDNTEKFITIAENEGNVASVEYFIDTILNRDYMVVGNCLFKLY